MKAVDVPLLDDSSLSTNGGVFSYLGPSSRVSSNVLGELNQGRYEHIF